MNRGQCKSEKKFSGKLSTIYLKWLMDMQVLPISPLNEWWWFWISDMMASWHYWVVIAVLYLYIYCLHQVNDWEAWSVTCLIRHQKQSMLAWLTIKIEAHDGLRSQSKVLFWCPNTCNPFHYCVLYGLSTVVSSCHLPLARPDCIWRRHSQSNYQILECADRPLLREHGHGLPGLQLGLE